MFWLGLGIGIVCGGVIGWFAAALFSVCKTED